MDKFLETYSLPKLSREESENLDRPTTTNDIEAVIKNLPAHKSPGLDGSTDTHSRTDPALQI